jgi:serine/threonine protein kinase
MRFCLVCRYCYDNHDTICSRGDGAPLLDWPQKTTPTQENWVSGSCQLTERYRLIRLISSGGMGTVFEGVDKNLGDRPVAIKILHRYAHLNDPDALERFQREARAASQVNHLNVAVVHDYGVAAEWGAFMIMELIDGENLAKRLKAVGRLPVHVSCQIAQQVSEGTGALHRSGFVHRDLKSSNIIIALYDEDDGLVRIKVVDFGIVKAITPLAGDEDTPTSPGLYVGTPSRALRQQTPRRPLGHLQPRRPAL